MLKLFHDRSPQKLFGRAGARTHDSGICSQTRCRQRCGARLKATECQCLWSISLQREYTVQWHIVVHSSNGSGKQMLKHRHTLRHVSHVTRKPVFGVCDQVRLKPVCSATVTSYGLEISAIASRGIRLSRQRTKKALIRLHGRADWSAPLLFAYGKNRVSHDLA